MDGRGPTTAAIRARRTHCAGRKPVAGYSVCAVGGGGGGDEGSAAFGGGGGAGAADPSPATVAVGAAAADSGASVIWPCSDSCAWSEVTS